MSEVFLNFDSKSKAIKDEDIKIEASSVDASKLKYRFFEGKNSVWTPITEFQDDNKCTWRPSDSGKYLIMVQAKEIDSKKTFDYSALKQIQIKDIEKDNEDLNEVAFIKNIYLEKTEYILGDKINISVEASEKTALVRLWRKSNDGWEPLRDYSLEHNFSYVALKEGREEFLVECKHPNSENVVDDYKTIVVKVEKQKDIEINVIKCLNDKLIVNEELIFEVNTNLDGKRSILFKFLLIDKSGNMKCVQDYSTYNICSFKVKKQGQYKLLCLARDMFSTSSYDDRAVIQFNIKPYEKVVIRRFYADLLSPQLEGSNIKLFANAIGGRELVYRYVIDGPIANDTGYIRASNFIWQPKASGIYNITLKVKDISSNEDYEAIEKISYEIEKKGEKPPKIINIITSKEKNSVINDPINIKVIAEGGTSIKYSFIVFKNGVEVEKVDYGDSNWVNFLPTEKGRYEVEVKIKDKYSNKDYDVNSFVNFEIKEYVPAKIEYIIKSSKEYYIVGDTIDIEAVCLNTQNVQMKYITKINGHEIENTGFIKNKKLTVSPKCSGKYIIEVYAKNLYSDEEYDDKSKINLYVIDAIPVNNTTIEVDKCKIRLGEEVTFTVSSKDGKEVCYEFYIMEKGNWVKMQGYSRKNYYTFVPFSEGNYRLLVLSKSSYKKINYEDYATLEFIVVRD